MKSVGLFAAMGLALVAVGLFQSWNVALAILNLSLISAVMAIGVNIQWGYAGLFNVGVMGFAALGRHGKFAPYVAGDSLSIADLYFLYSVPLACAARNPSGRQVAGSANAATC